MPNWVSNRISIVGEEDAVMELREILRRPYKTVAMKLVKGGITYEEFIKKPDAISFYNLIPSPNDDAYHTKGGTSMEPDGWYAWNNKYWGTKWDACDETGQVNPVDKPDKEVGNDNVRNLELSMRFDTAWSPPLPVFAALIKECGRRNLSLTITYEEEQGWGGYLKYAPNGEFLEDGEWDIPQSHAEYVYNPHITSECRCSWLEEPWDFFEDCPDYMPEPVAEKEATV